MGLNRVVVTGAGAVTPYGRGVATMMDGLAAGKSCVVRMEGWENQGGLKSLVAAPAPLSGEKLIPRQKRRSMSRVSIFAVQAAEDALADAGLAAGGIPADRIGCIVGSTLGSASAISEFYETFLPTRDISMIPSMLFFKSMAHTAAMNVAQYLELKGYVMATCAACASGLQAIGTGYDLLRLGVQDALLCGGSEELHPSVTGIFDLLFATSTKYNDSPQKTPRPFDADRDGIVCGEGAGIVVLETLDHARSRGARILAEVAGYNTGGSGDHVSQSNRESVTRCMRKTMEDAGVRKGELDYVSAHATATVQGDQAEAEAICEVAGDAVPVSGLKGHMGHTLGASGAIELIATIGMMRSGTILPGLNLERVAPECAVINHVREPLSRELEVVMKNCFAFGGVDAALILKKA